MRFTKQKDGKYVIDKKHISLGKDIVSGAAITKLAMYEDVAPTPADLVKVVKSAQEMLDGISFTPNQVKVVEKVVRDKCERAVLEAFNKVCNDLETKGFDDALKFLRKEYNQEKIES